MFFFFFWVLLWWSMLNCLLLVFFRDVDAGTSFWYEYYVGSVTMVRCIMYDSGILCNLTYVLGVATCLIIGDR